MFNLGGYEQAFIIGSIIAIATSLLSPFLVLRNESLIADGISHTSFFGFTIGAIFVKEPVYIALAITIVLTILMKVLIKKLHLAGDAAIGIMATVGFALGLIMLNLKDYSISFETLMQGSILTATDIDLLLALSFLILIFGFVVINYHDLFALTFDQSYSRFNKVNNNYLEYALVILTSSVIVIGIRIIGTLLITALIIFPTLIAIRFKQNFFITIIIAVIASLLAVNLGLVFTGPFALALPPAPVIVLCYLGLLIIAYIYEKLRFIKRRKDNEISND